MCCQALPIRHLPLAADTSDNLSQIPDDAFFSDPARHPEDISILQRLRLFSHQRVSIRVTSRNPAQRRVIVLDVYPHLQDSPTMRPPDVPRAELTMARQVNGAVVIAEPRTDGAAVLLLTPTTGTRRWTAILGMYQVMVASVLRLQQ